MKEKTYFEILVEMDGQKDSEREKRIEIGEKCLNAIKSLES